MCLRATLFALVRSGVKARGISSEVEPTVGRDRANAASCGLGGVGKRSDSQSGTPPGGGAAALGSNARGCVDTSTGWPPGVRPLGTVRDRPRLRLR
mmetsp:Transcript_69870/g.158548  ORF Transcript_69870/g.158548 Transcript_69870/m.158548 type:complete len:96 (+) Transcript_69870:818-1105(+)